MSLKSDQLEILLGAYTWYDYIYMSCKKTCSGFSILSNTIMLFSHKGWLEGADHIPGYCTLLFSIETAKGFLMEWLKTVYV